MTRKGESITLSLTPEEKAELEKIALEHKELWGDKPNVSQLIRAIANRKYQLIGSDSPQAEYIEKLKSAIKQAKSSLQKLEKLI